MNDQDIQPGEDTGNVEVFPVRFTARNGFVGWLDGVKRRLAVYGSGSLELAANNLTIRGWKRTWLGVASPVVLSWPLADITIVSRFQSKIRIEAKHSALSKNRIEAIASSTQQADAIVARLPSTSAESFSTWKSIEEFNAGLHATTPTVWVTPTVVALNILVFLVTALTTGAFSPFDGGTAIKWGSNFGLSVATGQWWRLITGTFLHGGVLHLALNMWVLWSAGRLTERLYGWRKFLFIYLAAAILSSATTVAWDPARNSIGASGAIFGVLGAFIAYLGSRRNEVPRAVVRSHLLSTLLFVTINVAAGFFRVGIDNPAHVGGLAAGFICGWILAAPDEQRQPGSINLKRWATALIFVAICFFSSLWFAGAIGSSLSAPQQYWLAHKWYLDGQTNALRVAQEISARMNAGTISSEEVIKTMEKEEVPFWRDAYKRLEEQDASIPKEQQVYARLVGEYVGKRIEWAEASLDSVKSRDKTREAAALAAIQEFQHLISKITRLDLRAKFEQPHRSLSRNPLVQGVRNIFSSSNWKCVGEIAQALPRSDRHSERNDGPSGRALAGCDAQRMFQAGEFSRLNSMIDANSEKQHDLFDGSSRLAGIYAGLSDLFEYETDMEVILSRLADWRRAIPKSPYPDIFEGFMFSEWAWKARGNGYATSVTQQGWAQFTQFFQMAEESLQEGGANAQSVPFWYQLAIPVGLARSTDTKKLKSIFDSRPKKFRDYLPIHRQMLRALQPRWGGSFKEMDDLINELYGLASPDDRFSLYTQLYVIVDDLEGDQVNFFDDTLADWAVMTLGFEELMKQHPKSAAIVNQYAKMACKADDRKTYRSLRPRLDDLFEEGLWSQKWSLKTCDKQIPL